MPEKWVLEQYKALPLMAKVHMSQARIREWYDHWQGEVYISFSGGKDSTVLAHLVHDLYPNVPLVFSNTGLEYPEIQAFARKMGAVFVRPKMRFSEVISTYGYPIISKEIAEAIYYARRIKNSGVTKQRRTSARSLRTREGVTMGTKDSSFLGGFVRDEEEKQVAVGMREAERRRNQLQPNEENTAFQKMPMGTYPSSDKWEDWRRQSFMRSGPFEESKSLFNKEKWLPLCRETQFFISHMCCNVMKKGPIKSYQKAQGIYPYVGTLAEESRLRTQAWLKHGCNAFEGAKSSQPLSFWREQDILRYIVDNDIEISEVYGDIVALDKDGMMHDPHMTDCGKLKCTNCDRTGCIFCGFGVHLEKGETRFQRLAKTHPKQYEYCMRGGQWVDNPKYDPTAPEKDGEWINWNPKKIWVPSKEGLGMKKVFDDCNEIYGKNFIKYE